MPCCGQGPGAGYKLLLHGQSETLDMGMQVLRLQHRLRRVGMDLAAQGKIGDYRVVTVAAGEETEHGVLEVRSGGVTISWSEAG